MPGILYTASVAGVAVSAAQDLWEVLAPSDAILILHGVWVSQESDAGDAEDEMLLTTIRRVTGAPTSGSGGSTPTPTPQNGGNAASGATVEANNTTQISGGTSVLWHAEAWNVRQGLMYYPAPEHRLVVSPSTRFVVELDNATADEVTLSSSVMYEELGGA